MFVPAGHSVLSTKTQANTEHGSFLKRQLCAAASVCLNPSLYIHEPAFAGAYIINVAASKELSFDMTPVMTYCSNRDAATVVDY